MIVKWGGPGRQHSLAFLLCALFDFHPRPLPTRGGDHLLLPIFTLSEYKRRAHERSAHRSINERTGYQVVLLKMNTARSLYAYGHDPSIGRREKKERVARLL